MKNFEFGSIAKTPAPQSGASSDSSEVQVLELSSDEMSLVGGGDDVICW